MNYHSLHSWDVTPKEAVKIQKSLRGKIIKKGVSSRVRLVAGVDVGFPRYHASSRKERASHRRGGPSGVARAAAVVMSFPGLEVVEKQVAEIPATFPYIPGLLSFREAPSCLAAIKKMENEPDLFIFDAQGYAHPRRMGLAAHLGLFLDKPSIGCAKSKLVGEYETPGNRVGNKSDLLDKGEVIGAVLRTKPRVAPLFVSIGHKIALNRAVNYVLACTKRGNRLPETTRFAHQLASLT